MRARRTFRSSSGGMPFCGRRARSTGRRSSRSSLVFAANCDISLVPPGRTVPRFPMQTRGASPNRRVSNKGRSLVRAARLTIESQNDQATGILARTWWPRRNGRPGCVQSFVYRPNLTGALLHPGDPHAKRQERLDQHAIRYPIGAVGPASLLSGVPPVRSLAQTDWFEPLPPD